VRQAVTVGGAYSFVEPAMHHMKLYIFTFESDESCIILAFYFNHSKRYAIFLMKTRQLACTEASKWSQHRQGCHLSN
jgi:hypothetical protein